MLKIDSHQHFWKYDPQRDGWINESMNILKDDFLPEHLLSILQHYGFAGSVVVQSDQSAEENRFQLKNAENYPFIKGVVGWVDLQAVDLQEQLSEYKKYDKLKGFRHILQSEADRALMLRPDFINGIRTLSRFDYTYDLLIFPDQLTYAKDLASAIPQQLFILDHLGKPDIRNKNIRQWSRDILELGKRDNVFCKASGMVTEADLKYWKEEDLRPYLDVLFEAFGPGRILFGSDWPVCRLAATYGQVTTAMNNYMAEFSKQEQEQFWGGNALRFYKLKK